MKKSVKYLMTINETAKHKGCARKRKSIIL